MSFNLRGNLNKLFMFVAVNCKFRYLFIYWQEGFSSLLKQPSLIYEALGIG